MPRVRLAPLLWLCALSSPVAARQAPPPLVVHDAWIREAAAGQASTAAYLVIDNHTASATALESVDCECADTVELHTMRMSADGSMMTMAKIARVPIPASGSASLAPGGDHIMLFKVTRALEAGRTVTLTLHFANGETRAVTAVVRTRADTGRGPMGPMTH